MKYCCFLFLFFLLSESRPSKAENEDNHCIWYGQCGLNPSTSKPLNCLYNGPAKPIDGQESRDILAQLCPEFAQSNSKVCCDHSQLSSLQSGMKSAQEMMAHCPSCWKNFRELYCRMTCSPNNSMFINITKVAEDEKSIISIQYFVDKEFRDGLYNSCKGVIFPGSKQKIMNFMCGTSADKCDPLKFLRFIGDPSLNGVSPFLVQYPSTTGRGFTPMKAAIRRCNETVFEPYTNRTGLPCSCEDCPESCHHPLPVKFEHLAAKIIVTLKPTSELNRRTCYHNFFTRPGECLLTGTILRLDILRKVLQLQLHLTNMSVDYGQGKTALGDFCVKSSSNNCIVESVLQYWQNDAKKLNKCVDISERPCQSIGQLTMVTGWGDHLKKCMIDPNLTDDMTALHLSCKSLYDAPVPPEKVLGGYEETNYSDSSLLFVTFAIKEKLTKVELVKTKAWQAAFVKYVRSFEDENLQLAYVPFDYPPASKLAF